MSRFINFNAFQSLCTALMAGITAAMLALGCTTLPSGNLECAHSAWLTPKIAGTVILMLTFLKLVLLPALAPGGWFRNIFEQKVPVSTSGAPGTVRPSKVQPTPIAERQKKS